MSLETPSEETGESHASESREERPPVTVTWEGETMAIISNGVATWKVDFGDKKSEWLNKPGELSEGDYQHLFNTGYLRVAMQEGETADTRLELREVAKALEAEREQSMS